MEVDDSSPLGAEVDSRIAPSGHVPAVARDPPAATRLGSLPTDDNDLLCFTRTLSSHDLSLL